MTAAVVVAAAMVFVSFPGLNFDRLWYSLSAAVAESKTYFLEAFDSSTLMQQIRPVLRCMTFRKGASSNPAVFSSSFFFFISARVLLNSCCCEGVRSSRTKTVGYSSKV